MHIRHCILYEFRQRVVLKSLKATTRFGKTAGCEFSTNARSTCEAVRDDTTKRFERLRGMGKIQKEERWVFCEIAAKR